MAGATAINRKGDHGDAASMSEAGWLHCGSRPGARNVAAKPGVPISMYVSDVAEIDRIVNGEKSAPIVIYCNGRSQ